MWMTIPWTKQPKTPKDRLLDVLAKVPTILEDVDTLASAPHFDGFIPLLQLCQEVDKGLSSWLAIHAPLQHYEEIRAQGFEDPTAEDLVVAEAMGLCWSGYVYTHLSIRQALKLVPHLAGGSDPVVAALEFSERTDPRTYYGLILEIAPIFFKPSAKTMFSKACAFSMGVAMGSALISEGPESELCQQLLSIFTASDEAIKMGKFLQSTIKDFPPLMVGTC
jgi:hypothetical protein